MYPFWVDPQSLALSKMLVLFVSAVVMLHGMLTSSRGGI